MKLSLTRLLLINKRLFQTWSFLVLLALIPLTAFGLSRVSTAEKGILTIAVASEDEYLNQPGTGDPVDSSGAAAVVSRLQAETTLLRFTFFGTPEQAKEAAASGKADCAWIFCEGYEQNIAAAANGYPAVIVNVYAQSDTVFMKLAREKLFAALYPDLSRAVFRGFLSGISGKFSDEAGAGAPQDNISEDPDNIDAGSDSTLLPEDELNDYYSRNASGRSLIRFARIDASGSSEEAIREDYLLLPLRGLLAILIFAACMTAVIFYAQDERNGCFTWLSRAGKKGMLTGYLASSAFWTSLMSLLALRIAGSFTTVGHEIYLLFFYCLASCAMCSLLRFIFRRAEYLATLLPLFILLMLGMCPVFLNIKQFRILSGILPAFHYLHAVGSASYARSLIILAVVLLFIDLFAEIIGFIPSAKLYVNPKSKTLF